MEKKFVTGLFVSRRENAPEFIIANLSFNEKFIDYLKDNFNSKGYVNIDLKISKEGKMYADLNNWKPQQVLDIQDEEEVAENFDASQIPF